MQRSDRLSVRVRIGKAVPQIQPAYPRLLTIRSRIRYPPVGWVDDQRRALVLRELDASFVPELVVRQDAALRPRLVSRAGLSLLRVEKVSVEAFPFRRLEGGRLFRRERCLLLQRRRTAQRCQGAKSEDARDVRLAVRGSGRNPTRPPWRSGSGQPRVSERATRPTAGSTTQRDIDGLSDTLPLALPHV